MTTAEALRDVEKSVDPDEMVERLYAQVRLVLQDRPRDEVRAELERAYDMYDSQGDATRRDAVGLILDCVDGYCSSYAAL